MVALEFFNPGGKVTVSVPHAARLPSLSKKRIGLLCNNEWQSDRSLPLLKKLLEEDFPDIDVLPIDAFPTGNVAISQESTIAIVKQSGVDAVVLGNAACGACATAIGTAAARLEAEGIPTVVLVREDFANVLRNAVSGLGLAGDTPMVTFPMDVFMQDSNLSPVEARRKEFYAALTDWCAESTATDESEVVSVEAPTFEGAMAKANNLMITSLWGDGLPLWPATRERVDWILAGTDLPRHDVLGRFPPRGATATVESCAIALAMAGGRPEYLPVLIAAVEALLDETANSAEMQATSGAAFPVVIVNGPIARDIRLSSGFGCLGPDPQRPAGASIGRALRQMQQNLGGALPGVGTMATWGASRATNMVFAEDEEGLPPGWLPHGTERHGFAPGTNSVSFFWATGASNVARGSVPGRTMAEDCNAGLHCVAELMSVPHAIHYIDGYETGTPGSVLVSSILARQMHSQGYTSKQSVREFLWENSAISRERLDRTGGSQWIEKRGSEQSRRSLEAGRWPICAQASNIVLLVAGGEHPMHAFWMTAFSRGVVGRVIRPSQRFETLLRQADRDLGCAADACAI